jgi:hypothetical protein
MARRALRRVMKLLAEGGRLNLYLLDETEEESRGIDPGEGATGMGGLDPETVPHHSGDRTQFSLRHLRDAETRARLALLL